MKLPFTEKFLWDLYNLINPDKPVKIRFLPTSWSELIYPEYIQLKKEYERKQDRERFRKIIYYLKKKMNLSIIIPVYNESKTIKQIIERVQKVNLNNIRKELIVVNDCSKDNSKEIIKEYTIPNKNLDGVTVLSTCSNTSATLIIADWVVTPSSNV